MAEMFLVDYVYPRGTLIFQIHIKTSKSSIFLKCRELPVHKYIEELLFLELQADQ